MLSERHLEPTLSTPRVEPRLNEAIASWFFRLGRKQLLTDDEVNEELGFSSARLDRAPTADRLRIAAVRTDRVEGDLRPLTHPYFSAYPTEAGRVGLASWAVCPTCLADDRKSGGEAYVRLAWVHPLATVCLTHNQPLVPATAGDFGGEFGSGLTALVSDDAAANSMGMAELDACREASSLADGSDETRNEHLRDRYSEVSDIADALATQANTCMGGSSLESRFENRWWGLRGRPGAVEMPDQILCELEARDRLPLVRTALRILGLEQAGPAPDPIVESWIDDCSRLAIPRARARSLRYSSVDPLIIIALGLPVHSFHRLGARSDEWSPGLRARWQAASTVAAFSGFT